MTTRNSVSDSDETKDIVQKKELEPYDIRIKALEDRVGTNEQFAGTFKSTTESQHSASNAIMDYVRTAIKTDPDTRDAIKAVINDTDRKQFFVIMSKFGAGIWAVVLLGIGALLDHFFK